MKNIMLLKNTLLILLFIGLCFSCVREPQSNNSNPKPVQQQQQQQQQQRPSNPTAVNSNKGNLKSGDYAEQLRTGLGIAPGKVKQILEITESYREKIKAQAGNANQANRLKLERQKALLAVISPAQIEQKSYIDAMNYGLQIKSPVHPINIKKSLNLTDRQILDFIMARSDFREARKKLGKNIAVDNPQLLSLITNRDERIQQIFSATQFSQYKELIKQAYGS